MVNGYKISIIIPVFNEAAYLPQLLAEVATQEVDEVIVVDDCSSDSTREMLGQSTLPGIRIICHDRNRGKGAAVRSALEVVSGDIIIIQDGDLEYDPAEYGKLLDPIVRGKADVVYGSRFKGVTRVFYFWHYVGNKFLTLMANMMFNATLTDMETGYKVFRKECVQGLQLRSDRWGFDPEITAYFLKRRYRIVEVPISYFGRTYEEGKKIRWVHGVTVFFTLLRCRFER